jgi:hypothetical protein
MQWHITLSNISRISDNKVLNLLLALNILDKDHLVRAEMGEVLWQLLLEIQIELHSRRRRNKIRSKPKSNVDVETSVTRAV